MMRFRSLARSAIILVTCCIVSGQSFQVGGGGGGGGGGGCGGAVGSTVRKQPIPVGSSSSSSSSSSKLHPTPNVAHIQSIRAGFTQLAAADEASTTDNVGDSGTPAAAAAAATKTKELGGLDVSAIAKYGIALGVQMGLISGLLYGLDTFVVPRLPFQIPFAVNAVAMYALSLKSRIFNPLSNRRPSPKTKEVEDALQRKMPSWTPPGITFPIVWLLLIGPLRGITSAMIIQASGGMYATRALLSLFLHLSIGDVWNTINNVERRYGTSVLGVVGVWASAAFAARQYYLVLPLAGKLLALKLIWLTVASSLIVRTWQLNPLPGSSSGKLSPVLPTKGDGETKLEWFAKE